METDLARIELIPDGTVIEGLPMPSPFALVTS